MGIASIFPTNFFNFRLLARASRQGKSVYIWHLGINFAENKRYE